MDELQQDVKEIKGYVVDLLKQGAIHNTILLEHEKRSTQLETRLTPLESDYVFRHKLFSVAIAVAGVAGSIFAAVKSFL